MLRPTALLLLLAVACDRAPAGASADAPAPENDAVARELAQLGVAIEPTLTELRRIDGELLAAGKAMQDDPEHKLEHFGTLRMRCADLGQSLGALQLDASAYLQAPAQRIAQGLVRTRDDFTRSQSTCQGFECPAACATAWNAFIGETQLAAREAEAHGVVIAPIRKDG